MAVVAAVSHLVSTASREHMVTVALALRGGSVVLDAAIAYKPDGKAVTLETDEKARADGGVPVEKDVCDCESLDNLPCWSCYRSK